MTNLLDDIKCYYISKLEEEFALRRRRNSNYSLRGFARFLEMDPATLSAIFKKKRSIPRTKAKDIANKLDLSVEEKKVFLDSIELSRTSSRKDWEREIPTYTKVLEGGKFFRVIAEWEYYAILSLLETQDRFSTPDDIAKKIGIDNKRAKLVVEELIELNFIEINEDGHYQRSIKRLKTPEDILSKALQASHKDALDIAKEKLESVDVLLRDFSSITMAVDPAQVQEAKKIIRRFRKEISALFESGTKKAVYQCNIQLFPLTEEIGAIQ